MVLLFVDFVLSVTRNGNGIISPYLEPTPEEFSTRIEGRWGGDDMRAWEGVFADFNGAFTLKDTSFTDMRMEELCCRIGVVFSVVN